MRLKKLFFSIATFSLLYNFSPSIANPWANEFQNAPQWVLSPYVEGKLSAVGSAKIGPAGVSFAMTEALANARDELARQIQIKVKNMFKNFTQVVGIGEEQTVDKVAVNVSKQVAYQVLSNSKQVRNWISPNGNVYVLVVIDKDVVKDSVKQSTIENAKKDKELWQKFLAKKAHEELEKEIEKEFNE